MEKRGDQIVVNNGKITKFENENVSEKNDEVQCEYNASTQEVLHEEMNITEVCWERSNQVSGSIRDVYQNNVEDDKPGDG